MITNAYKKTCIVVIYCMCLERKDATPNDYTSCILNHCQRISYQLINTIIASWILLFQHLLYEAELPKYRSKQMVESPQEAHTTIEFIRQWGYSTLYFI